MEKLSKLQIRAKVLSVISEIKTKNSIHFTVEDVEKYVEALSDIEDKNTLLDIFIKEYIKMEENEYLLSAHILAKLIDKDIIADKVFKSLVSPEYKDELKYKFLHLLKVIGEKCDYNEIPAYFDNPEEILDNETKKLLDNAVVNPESMLDFLDFITAISPKDRNILLTSLKLDYQGDLLANILYPVLYSKFDDDFLLQVIEILSESRSSLAIAPFNYLIKVSSNEEIVNECKLGLKKLKLAGATEEKAQEYFKNVVKDSKLGEIFATEVDGSGSQAFLITRKHLNNENYSMMAVIVSDRIGVKDCFGFFNIPQEEIIKIINKFSSTEGKYSVDGDFVKTKIQEAIDTTIEQKNTFPYEFICWSVFLSDVQPLTVTLEEYANQKCKRKILVESALLKLLASEYTITWFTMPHESTVLQEISEEIYNTEKPDIEVFNKKIEEYIDKFFDKKTITLWKNRILNLIYLLRKNNELVVADDFYELYNNQTLFETFKYVIFQRSIFNNFIILKEDAENFGKTTNIFQKNQNETQKYDIKKINKIIKSLEEGWING